MNVEDIIIIVLPLIAMVILVLLREKIGAKSSKKGYAVGLTIGVAIVVVYLIWNFFYRT